MAASVTTAGVLGDFIAALGLGIGVYADQAPAGTAPPYVEVTGESPLVPDLDEDGKAGTVVETVLVDLWQLRQNPTTGLVAENDALAPALRRGMDGARLPLIGPADGIQSVVYAMRVRHSLRLVEVEENIVHHALTVAVYRQA